MSKTDPEELIKNVLKSGRKTPSELRQLCLGEDITTSTYHRHLNKLVERGEVKHIDINYYELVVPSIDAEVFGIIREIDLAIESTDFDKCQYWIIELKQLCHKNLTGHIAELLEAIERYVNTDEVFESEEARRELAMTMSYILHNEKELALWDVKTANDVIKKLFRSVKRIALYDKKEGCHYALRFLGETGDEESVDVIVTLIKERPSEITGNFEEHIHHVLYDSELGKKQSKYVREKVFELSSSENEHVRSVAVCLQKRPRLHS